MLKPDKAKLYFFSVYVLISLLQIYAAYKNQLFVDEAFYWLEGQWLNWSYSEVPGWTPWTLALSDWIFPRHQFFIRIPNLLAALSMPWLAMQLANEIDASEHNKWLTGLLVSALPLLGIAGGLAIPDIWIVFFTLLAMLFLAKAINTNQIHFYLWLGVMLAAGINVHLRFWIVVLLTGLVFLWVYRKQQKVVIPLLKYSLPLMLIGFIPIIVFNLQHDFVLLAFQLKDRHPWEFQASHASFLFIQILITTPIVFWLCFQTILQGSTGTRKQPLLKSITYTATLHWMMYAVVGFFSDNLRLNIHWTLVSYVLLLVAAANNKPSPVKQWAWASGVVATFAALLIMQIWLHGSTANSLLKTRIISNAVGWQEITNKADELLHQEQASTLVVDQFKTLAELTFYSKRAKTIKSLPHPLNEKHGRARQLMLMDLIHAESTTTELVLIEHSSLKLNEQIDFYQSACAYLNGMKLIDTFVLNDGLKNFHFFKAGGGQCMMPPVVYHEISDGSLKGWVVKSKHQALALTIHPQSSDSNTEIPVSLTTSPLGNNPIFKSLNSTNFHLLQFEVKAEDAAAPMTLQIKSADQLLLKYSLN